MSKALEVLSDILKSMHVTGSVYFCQRLEPPWAMEFAHEDQANFHFIRKGDGWLTSGDTTQRLGPGDFVYAEPGCHHSLTSAAPGEASPAETSGTLLLCGYSKYDNYLGHPLLEALPALTVVSAEEMLKYPWLRGTLDQLSSEYLSQQPGSEVVVNKLTEILLVELIRINFGRSEQQGFIGALSDKQISQALQLLHANPETHWTLDQLASQVAMSRAAFARRFKDRVGRTMFEYLTALRMNRAQQMLRDSGFTLFEIANRVGYESDLAFAKTFKRLHGMTPTQYRKQNL